jgi:hypothetical protein
MPKPYFSSKNNNLYITHINYSYLVQQYETNNHTGNNTFSYTTSTLSNNYSTCYTSNATIGSLVG